MGGKQWEDAPRREAQSNMGRRLGSWKTLHFGYKEGRDKRVMDIMNGGEMWIRILEQNGSGINNTGWSVLNMSVSNLLDMLEKQHSLTQRDQVSITVHHDIFIQASPSWVQIIPLLLGKKKNIAISSNVSNCWNSTISVVSSSFLRDNSITYHGHIH